MTTSPTPERQPFRDELLRAIGRNVVNFQYLEATLRSLMPALSTSGTVKELQARHLETTWKYRKSGIGELASEFRGRVFSPPAKASELSDEAPTEPQFSYSARLESTPESIAEQKRALQRLVEDRNRLVHSDLLSVDLNSDEACRAMCAKLDEQNGRILRQLDSLNAMRNGILASLEEFRRLFKSEDFLTLLRSGEGDS